MAYLPPGSAGTGTTSPPSLRDILSNTAPPPYTLGAFMAFLSQNHCLETLEFTMDAERYRTAHTNILHESARWAEDANERVCALWQKLIHAYILPCGPREVNLPAHVRDRLLSLPAIPTPPQPSELDEAVTIVYELMSDSVLVPFLASVASPQLDEFEGEEMQDHRHGRSRLRMSKDSASVSSAEDAGRSPKTGFLPMLNMAWSDSLHRSGSSSSEPVEREAALWDDTGSTGSPSGNEPMTPPTTPPTSDWAFSTSPGSLHRAINAHNNGWKKMGAKLGLSRRSRNKRSHNSITSGNSDIDTAMTGESISDDKMQTTTQTPALRRSNEWEEPHPGQRFPLTMAGNARRGVVDQNCNGGQKIGMAAKGYAPYGDRGRVFPRRLARPRLRAPSLKPLKIPASLGEVGMKKSSEHTLQSETASTAPILNTPMAEEPMIERGVTPASRSSLSEKLSFDKPHRATINTTSPSEISSPRLSMTDFSNHVNVAFGAEQSDYHSVEFIEPEISSYLVPDEDPYGWEAELQRRYQATGEDCPAFQFRRAGGAKRSLLHRVFNLGARDAMRPATP
ncbi:hypothetical protein B0H63DRAFT_447887 [Podospora didyma]|uniref:RGS domain-containing protein n=1 Tax=Podospora didyma TaxID=330526 RepID=A0AAE0NSP5_9PEZI|nr:hypothetical protein B0H63DRAFT_447887 [Podospora didyma]